MNLIIPFRDINLVEKKSDQTIKPEIDMDSAIFVAMKQEVRDSCLIQTCY